jgi:hypothetical protein
LWPAERRGTILDLIRKRFPRRREVIAVLGIAVFLCFSWTIIGFFNKLSSFILYFTPAEIASIFAFMMAFALLESLVVSGILLLLSVILPSSWLKEGFAFKGFVILLVVAAAAILFQKALGDQFPSLQVLLTYSILPILVIAVLVWIVHSRPKLQNILLNIQDRIQIMLFIYVPIGVIGLLVVMARNLL